MSQVKRSWDLLNDKKRIEVINLIINHFECERNEKIGVIAASEILDLILENVSPDIYNKGVDDSIKFIKEQINNTESDMNAILKK